MDEQKASVAAAFVPLQPDLLGVHPAVARQMTKRYRAASKKKKVIEESLGLTGLAAALRRATLSDRVVGGATSTGWSARPSSSSPAPQVAPAPGHGSGRTRRIRPRSATTIVIGEHRRARIAVTGFSQARWYRGTP
jgi:hypothetical protein